MPEVLGTSKSIYGFDPRSVPACCLWLDAADSNQMTFSSGSNISSWLDKSGLGNSATATGGSPVWTSNAIGGQYAMYMSNAPRFLGTFSPALQTSSLSVFAVAYSVQTSGLGHDQRLVSMTSNNSGSYPDYNTTSGIMPFDIQTNNLTTYYNYSTNIANLTNNTLAANQQFVASMVATSTKIDAWLTGTPFTTTGGAISSLAINSAAYGIGGDAWTSGAEPWYGYIGEVLIYSNVVTAAQRQAVEGYLAWKWGLNTSANSPTSIGGLAVWLDGADASSFTFSSGSNISVWNDKSGNGNNANIVTATPPTYSSANKAVVFAAASSMGIRGNMSASLSSASVFIVSSYTSNSGSPVYGPRLFILGSNNSTDNNLIGQLNMMDQALPAVVTYLNTEIGNAFGNINYQTGGYIPFSTPYVYTNISTYSHTTFTNFTLVNGATGTYANKTGTMSASGTYVGSANRYAIGNTLYNTQGPNGDAYNGNVYEVIVYNSAITDAQRRAVEGYLSKKWGVSLVPSLPNSHPFYYIQPYSRLFTLTDALTPWIWFDAADTSTITVSSGTNISAWSNKGAAGGSAISSTGSGTLTTGSAMPNGLNYITFPASAYLGFTIGIPNQPRAWFAVFKQTSQVYQSGTGGTLQYFAIVNQTTGNGQDSLFGPGVPTNTGTNSYNVSAGASGFVSGSATTTAPNGFNVFKQYAWVNSLTASSNTIAVDGVAQTLSQSCNAGSYQTASVLYQIGDRYGNSGQLCELIQFNSEITTGQRQSVESYLATKWGLAALPSTHPYYAFNPLSALPFSPTNIPSCIVWLDGDDPDGTGVRPASGATVSSWKDKSGQANHFTGSFVTTGTAPVWAPSLFNGCGGITMSGSSTSAQGSYFQATVSSLINVGTTSTFFIVCYVLSTSVGASRLLATSYPGNADDYNDTRTFLVQWYTTQIELYRLLSTHVTISSTTAGTILLLSGVFDGTNMYFYKSGVLSGTGTPGSATGYAPSTGNFGFNTIAIGRYLGTSSGNYSFNGYALEYIMYNQALTTAGRQQVEGYLSKKWGASLSVSHPYYSYVPVEQGFDSITPSTISAVTLSSLSATGGTLSWTASTNAVEYYWYIGTASGSGVLTSGHVASTTTSTSFTATLTASVTYYGWVIPRSSTLTLGATTTGSGSYSSTSYATGGTITTTGGRRFHTFNTNDNFVLTTYPPTAPIEVMCIGGGGGGGIQSGGGGGAGNMIIATFTSAQLAASTYAVVIGTGGAGGQISVSQGTNGTNTTFASTKVIALGGGGGGTYSIGGGKTGGCGGGGSELGQLAGGAAGTGTVSGGTQVSNLAYAGGTGYNNGSMGGAGGGGTSAVGASQPANVSYGGAGGAGTLYYGSYYGGGGGGAQGGTYWGSPYNGGAGGIGGGGRGSGFTNSMLNQPGTSNTGGGGGGDSGYQVGGAGGTGVCIISYTFP